MTDEEKNLIAGCLKREKAQMANYQNTRRGPLFPTLLED
jgi:hypothetical protein